MNKYKFSKRAMSLIASVMTLGIGFNSMANPDSNPTLVKSEEYKTDYELVTLEDYENAKKRGLLVYKLLDNSIVGWDMQPMMSESGKPYKCAESVEIPLHPVVQRSRTTWWEKRTHRVSCFYLPSINNPDESYLIRCDYDDDDPEAIECFYAKCVKSQLMGDGKKTVSWVLMNHLDDPVAPENVVGSEVCKFPTKILEKYLPRIDGNEMDEVKSCKFAGYKKESSCYKYIIGSGLSIGALCLYPFLLDN